MKIQIIKTYTHDIDIDAERKRIIEGFNDVPETRDRLLAIVDAFKEKNLNKVFDLYNNLPYYEEGEHPEQEFMGMWFYNIRDGTDCKRDVTEIFLD